MFVADNGIIFGTATTSDGHIHLIRWDADGNPEILDPPAPFGVVGLTSIDGLGCSSRRLDRPADWLHFLG